MDVKCSEKGSKMVIPISLIFSLQSSIVVFRNEKKISNVGVKLKWMHFRVEKPQIDFGLHVKGF